MPSLPVVSGRKAIAALENLGFHVVRQRGSHVILRRESRGCVIPLHRELAPGTLRSALKQAGVNTEEFIQGLSKKSM